MVTQKTTREPAGSQPQSQGFSLIELLIVVAIILIIAALAIPNFLQAKIAANQASAVSTVRTLNTASVSYFTTWSNGFPPTLATLGSAGATPLCTGAMLIDNSLATPPNRKSGYTLAYTPQGPAIANPPAGCIAGYSSYLVTAVPIDVFTGTNSYCSDKSFVLHFDVTGAPAATSAACDALPVMQ